MKNNFTKEQLLTLFVNNLDEEFKFSAKEEPKSWSLRKVKGQNVLVVAFKGSLNIDLTPQEQKFGLLKSIEYIIFKCQAQTGLIPDRLFFTTRELSKNGLNLREIDIKPMVEKISNKEVYKNIIGVSSRYANTSNLKELPIIRTFEEALEIEKIWKKYKKDFNAYKNVAQSLAPGEEIPGKPAQPVYNGVKMVSEYFWIEGLMFNHEENSFNAKKDGRLWRKTDGIILGLDKEGNYTNPIQFSKFGINQLELEKMSKLPKWRHVKIVGKVGSNTFNNVTKVFIEPEVLAEPVNDKLFEDNSSDKGRFELSMHTVFSQLEAISNTKEVWIEAAKKGLNGVALTDTLSVQAFGDAMDYHKMFKHTKPVFGVQMNAIENKPNFVFNPKNDIIFRDHQLAKDLPIIAFDIETTGLSPLHDDIIQLSAVKLVRMDKTKMVGRGKNRHEEKSFKYEVIDYLDEYVHTDKTISKKIEELTGITQKQVEQSNLSQLEAINKLKAFFDENSEAIIVGQNVVFDYTFINSKLESENEPKLDYQIFDTLPLARRVIPRSRGYNLTALTKKLKLKLDQAHNSLYDAEATGRVFVELISIALNGYQTHKLDDLPKLEGDDKALYPNWKTGFDVKESELADDIYTEMFGDHISLLAKNQQGLKDMYELISVAHTKHFYNSAKIYYDEILEKRSNGNNILYGSGDAGSLLFDKVSRLGFKEGLDFAKTQMFDYLEIIPMSSLGWNINFKYDCEKYQQYIDDMLKIANEIDAIPVVSGDVHYLRKNEKIAYDILHDLPEEEDTKQQHLKSATELKNELSKFVQDEKLLDDIVVQNTRKVVDFIDIDSIQPVHKKLTPPKIEGADDELRERAWKRAHELYGEDLPKVIHDRIEKELNSIIDNGYAVVYLTSKRLVDRSTERGYLVGSRGSVGGSFVAYLIGITEVNSLLPHYRSKYGDYVEFVDPKVWNSGFDLPPKEDPNHPGEYLIGDGHGASFEIFAGVSGKKVPDIDLNFASEIQTEAQLWLKDIFGEKHVFRVGNAMTIADKTAYGYVKNYAERHGKEYSPAKIEYFKDRLVGVKKSSGQHAAGILVVPQDKEITDYTPYTYPANKQDANWLTTQLTKDMLHDALLKEDILGHDDPSMLHYLQELTGVDPKSISQQDVLEVVQKIFSSGKNLKGLPEFGTPFARGLVDEAKPNKFSDLVQISGLSHGTGVWLGNAQELIASGKATLQEVIGTRDKILNDVMARGWSLEKGHELIQIIKKSGKTIPPEMAEEIKKMDLPDWYLDSLQKITYMFPAAHAVAYVYSAVRIAWFKLHYPREFYAAWMSYRTDKFPMNDILLNDPEKMAIRLEGEDLGKEYKESLDLAREAVSNKAFPTEFVPVDLDISQAVKWTVRGEKIYPGISTLPDISDANAEGIVKFRDKFGRKPETSKELKDFGVKLQKKAIKVLVGKGLLTE